MGLGCYVHHVLIRWGLRFGVQIKGSGCGVEDEGCRVERVTDGEGAEAELTADSVLAQKAVDLRV